LHPRHGIARFGPQPRVEKRAMLAPRQRRRVIDIDVGFGATTGRPRLGDRVTGLAPVKVRRSIFGSRDNLS
jgi:hypothetical protein